MVKDLTNLNEFTLENKTNEVVAIRYYLVNFVEKLQPGDTITLTPRSSEELAYYMKIQEGLETGVAKKLMPEDFAKIAMDYLVKEKGYDFVSVTPDGHEGDFYEFIFKTSDGLDTSVRVYPEDDGEGTIHIMAATTLWRIKMSTTGAVEDYNENSH